MSRVNVYQVIARAGKAAGIEFPVHPHQLRHACGYYLANSGQDTRAIQLYLASEYPTLGSLPGTVAASIKGFWRD
jgi:site-specific recombinase XerD